MTQHVRMNGEGQGGERACAREQFSERRRRQGPAALGDEHIGTVGVLPAQLPERTQLRPADRVRGVEAVLHPDHMQQVRLYVDLLPAQTHELRHPKAMSVGEEDRRTIAVPVPADLRSGLEHALELFGGQIFALAPGGV